jgi:hypothetical protein
VWLLGSFAVLSLIYRTPTPAADPRWQSLAADVVALLDVLEVPAAGEGAGPMGTVMP